MNIEEAIERCANKLLDFQRQVSTLSKAMSKELVSLKKRIADKEKTKIVYLERDRSTKSENKRKNGRNKYRTIDSFGVSHYFVTKQELLDSLDITRYELDRHLKGKYTVLDDLQIIVEKI